MTLDGFCDHTAGIADDQIHQHYAELLHNAGVALYGRITYQLMEYWQDVLKNPTGNKAIDEFALVMDKIPKIVFSHTLKNLAWETATLASQGLAETISNLKQQSGKDILVCSPGLIVAALNLNLIDEYQICVHPVIEGKGLPLFKTVNERTTLKLLKTKTFDCGAIILYYEPTGV